jgi:hypothetical protein
MTQRISVLAAVSLAFAVGAAAAERGARKSGDDAGVVFRKPFTLHVRVDREHYYEEKKDKIPYVYRGEVYLFLGEKFGLKIDVADGAVRAIRYEPDFGKADLTLEFSVGDPVNGKYTSMLKMQNRTQHTFLMDGAMTVPDRKAILETSITPVRAGLFHYESWPHPILQLALSHIRIQK